MYIRAIVHVHNRHRGTCLQDKIKTIKHVCEKQALNCLILLILYSTRYTVFLNYFNSQYTPIKHLLSQATPPTCHNRTPKVASNPVCVKSPIELWFLSN